MLRFAAQRIPLMIFGCLTAIFLFVLGIKHLSSGMTQLFMGFAIIGFVAYYFVRRAIDSTYAPSGAMVLAANPRIVGLVKARWPDSQEIRLLVDVSQCSFNDGQILAPEFPEAYYLIDGRGRYLGPLAPWIATQAPGSKAGKRRFSRIIDLVAAGAPASANALPRLIGEMETLMARRPFTQDSALALFFVETEMFTTIATALEALHLDIFELPDKI